MASLLQQLVAGAEFPRTIGDHHETIDYTKLRYRSSVGVRYGIAIEGTPTDRQLEDAKREAEISGVTLEVCIVYRPASTGYFPVAELDDPLRWVGSHD